LNYESHYAADARQAEDDPGDQLSQRRREGGRARAGQRRGRALFSLPAAG